VENKRSQTKESLDEPTGHEEQDKLGNELPLASSRECPMEKG
jgi:hypothetical protein